MVFVERGFSWQYTTFILNKYFILLIWLVILLLKRQNSQGPECQICLFPPSLDLGITEALNLGPYTSAQWPKQIHFQYKKWNVFSHEIRYSNYKIQFPLVISQKKEERKKKSTSMTNLVSWASYKQLIPRYKFDTGNLSHQLSPINKAIYVNQDTHIHTQRKKAADTNIVRARVWGWWYRKTQVKKNKTFLVWPVSVDKICPDNRSKRTAFASTPPVAMTSC